MRRREVIAGLGAGLASPWLSGARAQPSERLRRIGVLMAHTENDAEFHAYLGASEKDFGSSDGRKGAISRSFPAGGLSTTARSGGDPRKNLLHSSQMSF